MIPTSDFNPLDATQCYVPEGSNQHCECLSEATSLHLSSLSTGPRDSWPCHLFGCIFMLSMLEVAAEHKQLTTTYHANPADLHGGHVTFSHFTLVLPSLNNVLPAMVLQNKVVRPSIYLSHSLYHSRSGCISCGMGISISSRLQMMVMVFLLLLLSGDIETNPGPVGKHIAIVLVNLINKNKRWEWG